MQLVISNNSASNPQSLDLSSYIRVSDGEGLQPADPSFTQRVFSRSLLKAGATLSLTSYVERELAFPLRLKSVSSTGIVQLVQQINAIIECPGATATWQDDGMSQATTFDLLVGNLEIQYRYREAQQHFLPCLLRLFAQPFGRTAGPRPYAAASGVGPLLMISPYASSGAQVIGASTQAGVAGYGGRPQGASSGIFYPGSPSLAGDAPAQLQVSYVGGGLNNAVGNTPSTMVVSVLPDQNYQPLTPIQALSGATSYPASALWGSVYQRRQPGSTVSFIEVPLSLGQVPATWAGQHRLLAYARASGAGGSLFTNANPQTNPMTPYSSVASVAPDVNFGLYDLGTFSLRASETSFGFVQIGAAIPSIAGVGSNTAIDLGAVFIVPDNRSWFFQSSGSTGQLLPVTYIDDVLGDQFTWEGTSPVAPSPAGLSSQALRVTQFSRGLVPRPDPKDGLPIVAILTSTPSFPQSLVTAQVNVLERFRYVGP